MGIFTRDKPRPRVLRASAAKITTRNADAVRRTQQQWQETALVYYTQVGELWFAAQFYSRSFSKLELYAAEKTPGGWTRTKDQRAIDALDRIQDPGGGRSQLLGAYGKLIFLTGEAYLLGSVADYGEQWEMLSTAELRVVDKQTFHRKTYPGADAVEIRVPDGSAEPSIGDGVAYRLWRPSPGYSGTCDSPVRAVLELCEELLLSQRAARSHLRSRLAGNGILGIPDTISFMSSEPTPDDDPLEDDFLYQLTEAMVTPIEQEDAASNVVPIVIRGSAEDLQGIIHLKTHEPADSLPDLNLRKADIERIALGLDIPPEVLLGMSDANHWTAWQIDEQTWKAHLQPLAQHLVDELTAAYFRPALEQAGMTADEAATFSIAYDASAIINRPDRGKDAEDAFKNAAISYEAYLAAKGFSEADAPDDPERNRIIGLLISDGGMAATGVPSIKGERGETLATGQAQAGIPALAPGAPAEGENPGAPVAPPPAAAAIQTAKLDAAMEAARMRCAELAGARIRSKIVNDKSFAPLKKSTDIPARQIAAHLGRNAVEQHLGLAARSLVAGGAENLVAQLVGWGVDAKHARDCALRVELEAARSLFEVADGPVPESH